MACAINMRSFYGGPGVAFRRRWALSFIALSLELNRAVGQTSGQSLGLFGFGGQIQAMIIDNANTSQVESTLGGNYTNCGASQCSATGTSYINSTKSGWDFVSRLVGRVFICRVPQPNVLLILLLLFAQTNTLAKTSFGVVGGGATYYLNSLTTMTPLFSGATPVALPFLVEVCSTP